MFKILYITFSFVYFNFLLYENEKNYVRADIDNTQKQGICAMVLNLGIGTAHSEWGCSVEGAPNGVVCTTGNANNWPGVLCSADEAFITSITLTNVSKNYNCFCVYT